MARGQPPGLHVRPPRKYSRSVVAVIAWIAAAVFALAVLGFCAYELTWRARRLRGDMDRLADLAARAAGMRTELADAQQRLAAAKQG